MFISAITNIQATLNYFCIGAHTLHSPTMVRYLLGACAVESASVLLNTISATEVCAKVVDGSSKS